MVQEEIEGAFLYRPEVERQLPGVLHLTDIGGIRPAYHDMARKLAAQGYVVLMPNVFYRTSRPPVLERKPGDSEEVFRKRFAELTSPLTPEAIESDAAIYVNVLARHAAVLRHSLAGGGPDVHGGSLVTDAPTSPHLLLPRIHAQLYFGHAVNDRSMPEEAIRKLDAALAAWGGKYESEIYEGAYHGWTASDGPVYNAPQADRAFSQLTELFAAALP